MAAVRRLNGLKSRISAVLCVVTIAGLVLWNTELPSEYISCATRKIWISRNVWISNIYLTAMMNIAIEIAIPYNTQVY